MPITRTAMIDDDGSGTTGTIINNAWKQEFYGQIDAFVGPWTNITFNAFNFSAKAPMVWTVGAPAVIRNRFAVANKTLFWSIYLSWFSGSNVLSGSPSSELYLNVPAGLQLAQNVIVAIDFCSGIAGTPTASGLFVTVAAPTYITVNKAAGGNFALADIPGIAFTLTLEIG